jgi:hypothetical protein
MILSGALLSQSVGIPLRVSSKNLIDQKYGRYP